MSGTLGAWAFVQFWTRGLRLEIFAKSHRHAGVPPQCAACNNAARPVIHNAPKLAHNSHMAHVVKLGEAYGEGTEMTCPTQPQHVVTCGPPLDPVYVDIVNGAKVLHYRAADMVAGRLHKFEWNGEHFAALKSQTRGSGFQSFILMAAAVPCTQRRRGRSACRAQIGKARQRPQGLAGC